MRLIAQNLSGGRAGEMLFSGIDFDLAPGDSLIVTGPNGSGKSTLLRTIAGLLPQEDGTLRLEAGGEEWPTVASACHYLGHLNAMKTALTVEENLRFWAAFLGNNRMIMADALERVGLSGLGHLPFGYLSTGQKRRAALARLLLASRPIWLLDEPTAGLDSASEETFAALATEHLGTGGILIAATHQPLGVEGQALRLGSVAAGRVSDA
ncbi:heme ABC exporter ATP-binding protein CcmA [Mesorhizobium sp. BAC0120]|uniref:heme ABC exporter ATP-binding protein CcmA n=1 Tax=Mesorhizobium sp. BAC0120 TaxID=3090670 RepID=UPI00298D5EF1|nr:heme ABC exporter ATP-binding protein CcmA [Mesorhizobium sp. BAC0120]MDW6022046.1 heme ABC exporter ATP-binding protein CcmA [Mesorhizobium sp. BAC0120]